MHILLHQRDRYNQKISNQLTNTTQELQIVANKNILPLNVYIKPLDDAAVSPLQFQICESSIRYNIPRTEDIIENVQDPLLTVLEESKNPNTKYKIRIALQFLQNLKQHECSPLKNTDKKLIDVNQGFTENIGDLQRSLRDALKDIECSEKSNKIRNVLEFLEKLKQQEDEVVMKGSENITNKHLKNRKFGDSSSDTVAITKQLTIQGTRTSSPRFRLLFSSESVNKGKSSFEISCPPLCVVDWTTALLERTFDFEIFEHIANFYDGNRINAFKKHINSVNRYLSSDRFLRLLNVYAEAIPEFRDVVDEIFSPEHIAQYLPGGKYENHLDIHDWTRLQQFCSTSSKLRYVPTYNENKIVSEAISSHTEPLGKKQIETEFRRLWTLEMSFDITERYPHILDYPQFVALLSKTVSQHQYDRTRDLINQIDKWNLNTEVDDLHSAIEQAKNPNHGRDWQELLHPAAEAEQTRFEFVLANFLRTVGTNKSIPKLYALFICGTAADMLEKKGIERYTRTARFWEHYLRGRRGIDIEEFDSARQDLKRARRLCLQEIRAEGKIKDTNLATSWVHLAEARMKYYMKNNQTERAVKKLEKSADAVKAFEDFPSTSSKEYCNTRINVLHLESKGNQRIINSQYSKAKTAYGKAIQKLKNNDFDTEYKITFLENRISAIEASVDESEGRYSDAMRSYNNISDESNSENPFIKFHEARAVLCQVKDQIVKKICPKPGQNLTTSRTQEAS
ncbi:MAG: hypothetical protein ABEI13_04375 [Candidatus Paceibacteria bacterium]